MDNPCCNCIVLPVCLRKVIKYDETPQNINIFRLKCSLLDDFMYSRINELEWVEYNHNRMAEVKEFYESMLKQNGEI